MLRVATCFSIALLLLGDLVPRSVLGQCMLANPSFELPGTGGATFAGWNEFGTVNSSSDATHGAVAARLTGPNLGGWNVSACWQRLDTAPGERWSASVRGWHSSTNPLTGQSRAILNIEWRDMVGNLISYESHTVAGASTPVDVVQEFSVVSGPAPAGTVATHFLLGVLQSPTDPIPDVYYDQAVFDNLGPPTLDELQWDDFSGERTINFSGRNWRVKGPGFYGPGPNLFCDTPSCTWTDSEGRLHLTIQNISGSWYSTEVTLEEPLGYGDHIFTTVGRLDDWHENVVFGLFVWQYGACFDPANGWWNPYNEVDVEFSRWGNPSSDVGHFVAQPFDYPGNASDFDVTFSNGEFTSHAFRWLNDRIEYRSWRGGPQSESPANLIHAWTYKGPHIPRPEQPRVHINFWQFTGPPGEDEEVVIDQFLFVPAGTVVGISDRPPRIDPETHLAVARPNPFNLNTSIEYTVAKAGKVMLVVYDVSGRRVRTLLSGFVPAGTREVVWNGCDDSGHQVASGVYMYQFRAGDVVESRRVVLLK
jgi:hypothetical protein